MRRGRRGLLAASALLLVAVWLGPPRHVAADVGVTSGDWPTYGGGDARTFHGRTALDSTSVRTLAPAWFFQTGDAVTAQPTVVGGTVYVGSWDGWFYAIDAATGRLRWKHQLDRQPAVSPVPGHHGPGDITSDGGMVTSAATFIARAPCRVQGGTADAVVFGGGYTLYSLRASDGRECWKRAYPGTGVNGAADPNRDGTRIFSTPAVVGGTVLFSPDADGSKGYRGYLVGADLSSGQPRWVTELDVDTGGRILDDGCGNVWASPTIVPSHGVEVIGVADCNYRGTAPNNERVLAVDIATGRIVWRFVPPRLDPGHGGSDPPCDWDFGATANYDPVGDARGPFLGVAGKDGTYYRLDLAGHLVWSTNVVFGGFAGGFIASTAYDRGAGRVYGATALGDFGRFEAAGALGCKPVTNPRDQLVQEPSVHAFVAAGGAVAWQGRLSQSFAPTTTAGGLVFVCDGLPPGRLDIRDSATGTVLNTVPLPANCDSGAVPWGNALILGVGSSEQWSPSNSATGS